MKIIYGALAVLIALSSTAGPTAAVEASPVAGCAATRGGDAEDDIVLEAEPQRGIRGLDTRNLGSHGEDVPAHRARRALGALLRVQGMRYSASSSSA